MGCFTFEEAAESLGNAGGGRSHSSCRKKKAKQKPRVFCPKPTDLHSYIKGQTVPKEVEEHIRRCPRCREEIRMAEKITKQLKSIQERRCNMPCIAYAEILSLLDGKMGYTEEEKLIAELRNNTKCQKEIEEKLRAEGLLSEFITRHPFALCPRPAVLWSHLENGRPLTSDVQEHIKNCPDCQEEIKSFEEDFGDMLKGA